MAIYDYSVAGAADCHWQNSMNGIVLKQMRKIGRTCMIIYRNNFHVMALQQLSKRDSANPTKAVDSNAYFIHVLFVAKLAEMSKR